MATSGRRIAGVPSRIFEPGEVIFRQGDAGPREAYLVHQGRVEVRRRVRDEERILRTLEKGELLGEVALFGDAPHSATAVALERTTLLIVAANHLEDLIRARPTLAIEIIRQLARMASAAGDRPSRSGPSGA
jgi:CRP-like cAMP-binding protein